MQSVHIVFVLDTTLHTLLRARKLLLHVNIMLSFSSKHGTAASLLHSLGGVAFLSTLRQDLSDDEHLALVDSILDCIFWIHEEEDQLDVKKHFTTDGGMSFNSNKSLEVPVEERGDQFFVINLCISRNHSFVVYHKTGAYLLLLYTGDGPCLLLQRVCQNQVALHGFVINSNSVVTIHVSFNCNHNQIILQQEVCFSLFSLFHVL